MGSCTTLLKSYELPCCQPREAVPAAPYVRQPPRSILSGVPEELQHSSREVALEDLTKGEEGKLKKKKKQ